MRKKKIWSASERKRNARGENEAASIRSSHLSQCTYMGLLFAGADEFLFPLRRLVPCFLLLLVKQDRGLTGGGG
jgi:hypothetical protein